MRSPAGAGSYPIILVIHHEVNAPTIVGFGWQYGPLHTLTHPLFTCIYSTPHAMLPSSLKNATKARMGVNFKAARQGTRPQPGTCFMHAGNFCLHGTSTSVTMIDFCLPALAGFLHSHGRSQARLGTQQNESVFTCHRCKPNRLWINS
jgi:hypothetical protein